MTPHAPCLRYRTRAIKRKRQQKLPKQLLREHTVPRLNLLIQQSPPQCPLRAIGAVSPPRRFPNEEFPCSPRRFAGY